MKKTDKKKVVERKEELTPYQQTIKDIAVALIGHEDWPERLQDMLDGIEEDVMDILETKGGVPIRVIED